VRLRKHAVVRGVKVGDAASKRKVKKILAREAAAADMGVERRPRGPGKAQKAAAKRAPKAPKAAKTASGAAGMVMG
jgi:hypothetical protein